MLCLALLLLAARPDSAAPAPTLDLMPVPASIRLDAGRMPLGATFRVSTPRFRDGRLLRGIDRAAHRLREHTGIAIAPAVSRDTAGATLVVEVRGPGQAVQTPAEDESYTLDVSQSRVVLRAPTVVGALRGLETFLQLVASDANGFYLPLAHIADHPRFPWRGLLIDASRHFEPVDVIERNLDAMAMVKMNVLHWHLSDDQGFRVASARFPRLQRDGSDGRYYTATQIREVVAYARDRGIRVVPEFDMPGHSTSWFVGYPYLASHPGPYAIEREFGADDAAFDPTRETVYRFIDSFVAEMVRLFPDPYWHIGGDEVNAQQWESNARIRRFMRRHRMRDAAALQAYFNRRVEVILRRHRRRMVGWDEILNPGLPRTVMVQSWRGAASLGAGARLGYTGILSAGYYLDAMQTAADHYAVDPLPDSLARTLTPVEAARVLGGEACMWGELVTHETIDSRIWPRTAAIAERLWSPATVTNVGDMYRRLAVVSEELEDAGVRHLTGPARLLRRVAGTSDVGPLGQLAGLLEPVTLGQRMHLDRATQLTALDALADVVVPDPAPARALSDLAAQLVADRAADGGAVVLRDSLGRAFASWRRLPGALARMGDGSPLLAGADSAADLLAALGATGTQALAYLADGHTPPADWTMASLQLLDRARAPVGLFRIAALPAVRAIVLALPHAP